MTEKKFKVQAEVVSGKCPTCDEFTTLVGIDKAFYRCMSCGSDLEQHVNGKDKLSSSTLLHLQDAKLFVKEWLE
jgi:uncharacterized protein (DUF983 family)